MNQIISNGSSVSTEPTSSGPTFTPPADILEKGETVVMLLDIPGADPASLDVTLDKRILTIAARVTSAAPEGYMPTYIEFRDGTYERRFVFSEEMDGEHIDALLKDGVLRLTIPKATNTTKKIHVKSE
ncbi:Hsp20 family protein [Phyllobacterium sp. SYP-B3895]|uniref:Hsp20/alpha crystallin family protein n=1 Tax=Phyllobacterium sp. SYP-B3895 TaxID=2663240 RepID=UPI001299FC59|nr:Hsp20/alpha crystallin family protein [Phyllobacterium sp. SYP-B3895]MRG54628.1 Hsp20 family protein [Phyllobacterium sp. SYP-B3895]